MARVTTTKHGVQVQGGSLRMGANLRVTFQRTLRIPDDGQALPAPAGAGGVPAASDRGLPLTAVPDAWKDHGGVFMPLWQREALWLSFQGTRPRRRGQGRRGQGQRALRPALGRGAARAA